MKDHDLSSHDPLLASASILVIDDEPGMRHFLAKTLEPRVKSVVVVASPDEATRQLDQSYFDLVILDNIMPQKKGIDWVLEQRQLGLYADTILMTAYADLETAIAALRAGVTDFVLKPFRVDQILTAISRALDRSRLRRDNHLLRHALSTGRPGAFLGHSEAFEQVRRMVAKLAPLPTSVLFTGASGTGKDAAARSLHAWSNRADKPFVAVNCAAIAPDQIMPQLFGQFGDAGERPGLFMLADGGTLFLDEVAQMSEPLQAALLRVLDDKRIRPTGAEREIPLDLRFVFATNGDLQKAVAEGRFREDLFHRMNTVTVEMPLLSDRAEDISELAAFFMKQVSAELALPALPLNEGTLRMLHRYPWPGNVRELRNLIERSVILGDFPEEFAGDAAPNEECSDSAVESLDLVIQRHMVHILEQCDGNRAEAARRLGVSRKTIDRKFAGWGLS